MPVAAPVPLSAQQLRARAAALRRLAHDIEHAPVMQLGALAGEDTWHFPAADRCRDLLAADVRALWQAVVDLRAAGNRLDHAADVAAAAAVVRS